MLMLAVWNGYSDVVDKLLEAGADVNTKDEDDWVPLMFAAKEGRIKEVEKLFG